MGDSSEHQFRTKTGICRMTKDRIIIERRGVSGGLARFLYGERITRALIVNGVIGVSAFGYGVQLIVSQSYAVGILFCALGVVLFRSVWISRVNSASSVIDRSSVVSVEAHPPRPPVTRAYFTVWFMEKGRKRRRLIMLPGSLSGGTAEYGRAVLAMQQSGLLVAPKDERAGGGH